MSALTKALRRLDEDADLKNASKKMNKMVRLKNAGRLSAFGENHLRESAIKKIRKSNKKRTK